MNAKSPKSYQEKISGDDLSRVSKKFEATEAKKNMFLGTVEISFNLKAFPERLVRPMRAHVGSVKAHVGTLKYTSMNN